MQLLSSSSSRESTKDSQIHKSSYGSIPSHSKPDQEWKAYWYTRCEYQRIREDIKYVVSLALLHEANPMYNNHNTQQGNCLRGLESRLPEGYRQRQQKKEAASMIVFREQASHWECGRLLHSDHLTRLYYKNVHHCQRKALQLAQYTTPVRRPNRELT